MVNKIKLKQEFVTMSKSFSNPRFGSKSVLVNDPWEYVEMWLKRNCNENDAIFYWQQAKSFYDASIALPLTSSPLTSYYCFLNAVKTFLLVRDAQFTDRHGVTGYQKKTNISLSNEMIKLKSSGILPSLSKELGNPITTNGSNEYSLKKLLRNLVYIHRSYTKTYKSDEGKELFVPVNKIVLVRKRKSKESWFSLEIDDKYNSKHTLKKLKNTFIQDINFKNNLVVRPKKRIKWQNKNTVNDPKFINYHQRIRKNLQYIAGPSNRWYIKRNNIVESISLSSLVITFAAMHRLSELSRYEPTVLSKHLNRQHNWLLSEFIRKAPYQFIHEISSEITGEEINLPRNFLR